MEKRTWLFFLILILSAAGSFAALSCGQSKVPLQSYAVAGKVVDPVTGYGVSGVTILKRSTADFLAQPAAAK